MHKRTVLVLATLSFFIRPAFAAETIVGHETEKYFLSDGRMQRFEGQYEYTYLLEGDKITRTRVYDFQTRKIMPDNTIYQVQKQLNSDPDNSLRYGTEPVIRAFGQPDPDSVEMLVIEDGFVNICKSTSKNVVVSRATRLR